MFMHSAPGTPAGGWNGPAPGSELFEVGQDGVLRRAMPQQRVALPQQRAEVSGIYRQLAALSRLEDSIEEREFAVRQREQAVFERERAARELEQDMRPGGTPWPSDAARERECEARQAERERRLAERELAVRKMEGALREEQRVAPSAQAGRSAPEQLAERGAEYYAKLAAEFERDGSLPIELLLQQATAAKAALGPLLLARDEKKAQLETRIRMAQDEAKKLRGGEELDERFIHRNTFMVGKRKKQLATLEAQVEGAKARLTQLRAEAAARVGVDVAKNARAYDDAIEASGAGRAAFTERARELLNAGELKEGQVVRVPVGGRMEKAKVVRRVSAASDDWILAVLSVKDEVGGKTEEDFYGEERFARRLIYADQKQGQQVRGAKVRGQIRDIHGLCLLYRDAADANQTLHRLGERVEAAVNSALGRRAVQAMNAPLKATARVMEKVAEKYEGDMAQVCDLARMTFSCDDFDAATRALDAVYADREIEVTLCKDRLMAEFDSRETGGYRDALFNARELRTGHVVEVQITLRSLLNIKKTGGHAQYKLVRVLELNDEATYTHEGPLTDEVISHVRCGLVRKLVVKGGLSAALFDALVDALAAPTCLVFILNLMDNAFPRGRRGLGDLLTPKVVAQLAPHLQTLLCNGCAVTGKLPGELFRLTRLKNLVLSRNDELAGALPPAIGNLTRLEELICWGTAMRGPLPSSLGNLTRLGLAQLHEPHTSAIHCKDGIWRVGVDVFRSFEGALAEYQPGADPGGLVGPGLNEGQAVFSKRMRPEPAPPQISEGRTPCMALPPGY